MPGAVAELLRNAPTSPGKVEFAWRMAVGPAIGRGTTARLDAGVLLVDATTPQWAREVARSSTIILRQLQRLLGVDTVTAIHVRD